MVVLSLFSLLLTRKKKLFVAKNVTIKVMVVSCCSFFQFKDAIKSALPPPHGPLSRCADWSEELSVVSAVSAANATQPGGLLMVLTV